MCSVSSTTPIIHEWNQTLWNLNREWQSSENFSLEGLPDCKFYSQLRLSKKRRLIDVSVVKTDKRVAKAEISITFKDSNNFNIGSSTTKYCYDWIERCDFFSMVLPPTATSIKFKMTWYGLGDGSAVQQPPSSNLYDHMRVFLMDPSLSDVKIIVENEEIHAHKLILAAQSPVFRSMFENDMKEKKESQVHIVGIANHVMKNVLTYFYTGSEAHLDDPAMALKILVVAERYGIKKLKHRCEYKLAKSLTLSNALEIFEEANTHNAKKLQEEALNFMVQSRSDIIHTDYFDTLFLTKPELMIVFVKRALSN